MAHTYNVHAAKTQLSALIERVLAGETIVIARNGKPVAQLTPIDAQPKRKLGLMRGHLRIAHDFDAPLPDELLAAFEGDA